MKHSKSGIVIWFNRRKGFGEYFNAADERVFFTAFDTKPMNPPQSLKPDTTVFLRQTKRQKF